MSGIERCQDVGLTSAVTDTDIVDVTVATIARPGTTVNALRRLQPLPYDSLKPFCLKRLFLSDNLIGDSIMAKLIRAISSCCFSICELGVKGNDCSSFVAEEVVNLLKNKNLVSFCHLDLSWNNLGNDGGEKILQAMYLNETLSTLNLEWNGISSKIFPMIDEVRLRNKTIQLISIQGVYGPVSLKMTHQS